MGYEQGPIDQAISKYLMVRHEQVSDGVGKFGQAMGLLEQGLGALSPFIGFEMTQFSIEQFDNAVKRDAAGNYDGRDRALQGILMDGPRPRQLGVQAARVGNSMEDLRLSVRGWRVGNMVANGLIQTNKDLANWIALNIAEN